MGKCQGVSSTSGSSLFFFCKIRLWTILVTRGEEWWRFLRENIPDVGNFGKFGSKNETRIIIIVIKGKKKNPRGDLNWRYEGKSISFLLLFSSFLNFFFKRNRIPAGNILPRSESDKNRCSKENCGRGSIAYFPPCTSNCTRVMHVFRGTFPLFFLPGYSRHFSVQFDSRRNVLQNVCFRAV